MGWHFKMVPTWAYQARIHKETWVEAGGGRPGTGTDSPPAILPLWDDRLVCVACQMRGDRDDYFRLLGVIRAGIDPDAVIVIQDTLIAARDAGPAGDELLASLESGNLTLRDLAEHHHGRERGLVYDALFAMRCDRSGKMSGWQFPYRVTGGQVIWIDYDAMEMPEGLSGAIPDFVRRVMTEPGSAADHPAIAEAKARWGIDDERSRLLMARAVIRAIVQAGHICIPKWPGTEDIEGFPADLPEPDQPPPRTRRPDPEDLLKKRRKGGGR